ncbi:MAG: 4Fe-4S dicluster domain-containing protein [Chloroflexi bacterium]|nr:4Fe-4S dicluster domain-containing protein [Chloroflexota bacterium]
MSDIVERLASEYGLFLCVECGKCVAVCPMGEIFDDFSYEVSPRGVIERVLLDFETPEDSRFWFCLTCDLCTNLCPAGVRFRDFVETARRLTIEAGGTEHGSFCHNCGAYLWPRHTVEYLKQTLGEASEELLMLCPRCRKYNFGEKVKALVPGSRKVHARQAQAGESR